MKKVVVLYEAPASAVQQMATVTPEQMKAGMDAWLAWSRKAGKAIVDLGRPLGNGKLVSKSGVSSAQTQIVGFSILQGESMEYITGLLKEHPHLHMPGASVRVLEELPMPGGI